MFACVRALIRVYNCARTMIIRACMLKAARKQCRVDIYPSEFVKARSVGFLFVPIMQSAQVTSPWLAREDEMQWLTLT